MSEAYRQLVLSDALADRIDGRRVRAAVFTTFTFDPGFFELHVLPLLFPRRDFDHRERARRAQLEDCLQSVNSVAVYYDLAAISQDATPAELRFERIGMHRAACFHPKLVLLLVDTPVEDDDDDHATEPCLIVGTLSANLTRSGYWENVEAGHFEELQAATLEDSKRCSYRSDLLGLLRTLRRNAPVDVQHTALDMIHGFVRGQTVKQQIKRRISGGRYRTRLFYGQEPLADWLQEVLRPTPDQWHLEVVSPYFDKGTSSTLEQLQEVIQPVDTRVHLPLDADGAPLVDEATYDAIAEVADWGALPASLVERSGGAKKMALAPRRVHAKVYRLWAKGHGEVILVGSVNLTSPGHSHAAAGNLEAAFLVHDNLEARVGAWLRVDGERPESFPTESAEEAEEADTVPVPLCLRFDWSTGALSYLLPTPAEAPLTLHDPGGPALGTIDPADPGVWHALPDELADGVRELLGRTSFVRVEHAAGHWRLLVQEEGLAFKPSILTQLSAEEILTIWSLLTETQRNAFILDRVVSDDLEGLPSTPVRRYLGGGTMFDRFAGLFHAFSCLRRHIETAFEEGRPREVERSLLGGDCDSLPTLLARLVDKDDRDDVMVYVAHLCARQLTERIRREHPDFWKERKHLVTRIQEPLSQLEQLREQLGVSGEDAAKFLDWYEQMFQLEIAPLEAEA